MSGAIPTNRRCLLLLSKTEKSDLDTGDDNLWSAADTWARSYEYSRCWCKLRRRMDRSVHPLPERIVATVAQLAAITPDVLKSSTQSRSVGCARAAAAHLLRTHCGFSQAEIAQRVGRSTQTISDLTTRARQSLRTGGAIAELVVTAQQVLNLGVVQTEAGLLAATVADQVSTPTARTLKRPRPIPALRGWRRLARRTQQQLARDSGIARETLIRLEAGRPAMPHVVDQLADALGVTLEELLSGPDHTVEDAPVRTTFPLHNLVFWRELARLSRKQLAVRAGVASETLPRIENGRPARRDVVMRIADALCLAPSVLAGDRELDEPDGAYLCCTDCGALRPVTGFVRIKGTNGFYLRCRIYRAKRVRERYRCDPKEREHQKAHTRGYRERTRSARLAQLAKFDAAIDQFPVSAA